MRAKTIFNLIFASEVVGMIFAMVVFRLIQPKMLAALFAGGMFVVLGFEILVFGLWRREIRQSFTFPVGMVHLFFMSLPMLGMRILHYGTEFTEIRIWGLPGPVFHHLSEFIYLLLMIATAADRLRVRWRDLRDARVEPTQ